MDWRGMTTQNSTKTHMVGLPMAAISKKSSEKSPIATPRWDFYREDAGGATGVVGSVNSSAGIEVPKCDPEHGCVDSLARPTINS